MERIENIPKGSKSPTELAAKWKAPLLEQLSRHYAQKKAGFHVPGHTYGEALRPLQQFAEGEEVFNWFEQITKLDLTELSSTDDLHAPESGIMEAQKLAALCCKAEETVFLVGGSTAGNLGLILGIAERDEIVIVQRNVHKSIINGLRLTGARAVFLSPMLDDHTQTAALPSLDAVQEALIAYPEAKGVFLSSPNYYGVGIDLQAYVDLSHQYGVPLLVDEAHGAHYGHHDKLPRSAIAAGADAVVQSAHKTLPTLTMGAWLHLQGSLLDRQAVKQALAMIQSSSPSFIIMASLDITRAMLDSFGSQLFEESLAQSAILHEWIGENCNYLASIDAADGGEIFSRDPLRLLIYDQTGYYSGFDLQRLLEEQECWIEMAEQRLAVVIFTPGISEDQRLALQQALQIIEQGHPLKNDSPDSIANKNKAHAEADASIIMYSKSIEVGAGAVSSPVRLAFREQVDGDRVEQVPLIHSVGRVSARMVIPYPPGIPLLYPGEIVTTQVAHDLQQLELAGARFQEEEARERGMLVVHRNDCT